jgi:hypothetical protein
MFPYPSAAVERAMKVHEVMLRAISPRAPSSHMGVSAGANAVLRPVPSKERGRALHRKRITNVL